jgi:hypothetical protein
MGRLYSLIFIAALFMSVPVLAQERAAWFGDFAKYVATKPQADQALYEKYTGNSLLCVSDTLKMLVAGTRAATARELLAKTKRTPATLADLVSTVCDKVYRKTATASPSIWDDVRARFIVPMVTNVIAENLDTPLPKITMPILARNNGSDTAPVAHDLFKNKIMLGAHTGYATIVSLTGVNSDKAAVTFRRELDDFVEECDRETGEDSMRSMKVSSCAKRSAAQDKGRVSQRRAYCTRHTVYTEFGNFSLVNTHKEAESTLEGKLYRPIRTDWKDHKTEAVVGNCSACNTSQIIDTFRILCPASHAKLFDGYNPY